MSERDREQGIREAFFEGAGTRPDPLGWQTDDEPHVVTIDPQPSTEETTTMSEDNEQPGLWTSAGLQRAHQQWHAGEDMTDKAPDAEPAPEQVDDSALLAQARQRILERDLAITEERNENQRETIQRQQRMHAEHDATISRLQGQLRAATVEALGARSDLEGANTEIRRQHLMLDDREAHMTRLEDENRQLKADVSAERMRADDGIGAANGHANKLASDLEKANARTARETEAKDGAYRERNQLVAVLTKIWPSHIAFDPNFDEDDEWRITVCIHTPAGQATWHINTSELPLFDHLTKPRPGLGPMPCPGWDGHTTGEKYERLARIGAEPNHDFGPGPATEPDGLLLSLADIALVLEVLHRKVDRDGPRARVYEDLAARISGLGGPFTISL